MTLRARLLRSSPSQGVVDDAQVLQDIGVVLPLRVYLRELWQRRDFIWAVPLGQLRAQTQNTFLGGAWHLLNPLLTAILYYLVFGVIFGGNDRVANYPAFLVIGIFTFLYTSRTVTAGARSVTANMGLISQISFPRLALPAAAVVAETLSHAVALVALLVMLPVLGVLPSLTWLLIVPIFLLQAAFNLGLAMVVARLAFQYRDIGNLLPHALRFWMYASGVFFTVQFVTEAVGTDNFLVGIFTSNPAYVHITLMREALLGGGDAGPGTWAAAVVWALLAVGGGLVYFRAREVEYGCG